MKKQAYLAVSLTLAFLITTSGCVSNAQTSDITTADASINTAESSVAETKKEPTATAVVTKPTQKANVTPTPSVKETTAVTTTKASETTASAATTKATTVPAATTKAPVATTATPVATTEAPPVETTAAPATDYSAVCAEIRSKLIAILEANGQWDEAFTGESTKSGSQWWGVGFYDDGEMSTDDFAQHFYANKFSGRAICGTSITCYVADGNINIEYTAYWTS